MSSRTKGLLIALGIITAFGFGRWSGPEKVKIETKIVEVEKKTDETQTKTDRDKHKDTTTTEVIKPDGTKETTTHTVEDTQTNRSTDRNSTMDTTKNTETSSETTYASARVTVLALGAADITELGNRDFGISISRPILGPITVGAFGFHSGIVGAGIGLTF